MLRYYKDIFSNNVHLDTDTTYKTQYTVEIVVCICIRYDFLSRNQSWYFLELNKDFRNLIKIWRAHLFLYWLSTLVFSYFAAW